MFSSSSSAALPCACTHVCVHSTLEQARKLDKMLSAKGTQIDAVLDFDVPDSLLVDRVTGRWIHPGSGRSYHEKFAPPKVGWRGVFGVGWGINCVASSFICCVGRIVFAVWGRGGATAS